MVGINKKTLFISTAFVLAHSALSAMNGEKVASRAQVLTGLRPHEKAGFLRRFFFGKDTPACNFPADIGFVISQMMPDGLFYPVVFGQPEKVIEGHLRPIDRVKFSSDGEHFVTVSVLDQNNELYLWSLANAKNWLLKLDFKPNYLNMAEYDPISKTIAIGCQDGLKIYKCNDQEDIRGEIESINLYDFNWLMYHVSFIDGKIVATSVNGCGPNHHVYIYDPVMRKVEIINLDPQERTAHQICFNNIDRSGNYLIGHRAGQVIISNLKTREVRAITQSERMNIGGGKAFINDTGNQFLILASDAKHIYRMIYLFDTGDSVPLLRHTIESPHKKDIFFAKFAPHGKLFATGSKDGTVRLWDTKTCKPFALARKLQDFRAGSFSSNKLAVSNGAKVYIYPMIDYSDELGAIFNKAITLDQLLFVKFFNLVNSVAKERKIVFEKLGISPADELELQQAFYSFSSVSVRKYLKSKYKLDWQA